MQLIDEHAPRLGVAPVCDALSVPRANYYRCKTPVHGPHRPRSSPPMTRHRSAGHTSLEPSAFTTPSPRLVRARHNAFTFARVAQATGPVHPAPTFTLSCRGRDQIEHTLMCLILLVNHRRALRAYPNPDLGARWCRSSPDEGRVPMGESVELGGARRWRCRATSRGPFTGVGRDVFQGKIPERGRGRGEARTLGGGSAPWRRGEYRPATGALDSPPA
jgi:hypothetical protein